jgi:aspartate/methionine/tyrosine aminotransferase
MTKPTPSNAIQHVPRSGIRQVFDEAAKYPDCIRLEVGEPSFSTPAHIKEAAVNALAENFTRYTANAGIPELRSAIVDKLRLRNGISVGSNDVVVTSGGVAACFTALGVKAVHYRLRLENDLIPTVEDIERCITPKTKVLIMNSPGNPTGAVTPLSRLREILELAHRHNLWVISDEVYDEIWFDTPPHSLQPLDTQERVVSVFSFSKTYAMTGWRVGYLTGASEIVSHVLRAQEPTTSCVNSPAQRGAVAALLGDQQCVTDMRSAYASRARLVTRILDDHGVPYARPTGAFYTMVDISGARMSDRDFVSRMITERRVAVVPGSAFGPESGNVVRVSLASSESDLQNGVTRLASAVSDWSN